MPLIVTPPDCVSSLWEASCLQHGPLIHAASQMKTSLVARLHDYENNDCCAIRMSGLRCNFCLRVQEIDAWFSGVLVCCASCERVIVRQNPQARSAFGGDVEVAEPGGYADGPL